MYSDMNYYEELLCSMALRAGEMDALNAIDLDLTVEGEDAVIQFCKETVKKYLDAHDEDLCFDLFIEEELMRRFGV